MSIDSLALFCVISAVAISLRQIYLHLRNFHRPEFQLYICRIIFMVPVYAIQSIASLHFPSASVLFDTIRNCYEAYVVYTFMSLLISYLGGEDVIVLHFEMKGRLAHPFPFTSTFKPFVCNRRFFRHVKRGVVQFVFVKPMASLLALMLEAFDLYEGGYFQLRKGYLYLAVISNCSVATAMYSLILFYLATHERLAPFKPMSKFLCVKAVIFFSFWQSLLVASAIQLGWFTPAAGARDIGVGVGGDAGEARIAAMSAIRFQSGLVCVEMLGFAIAHCFAFSHRDFVVVESRRHKPLLEGLSRVLKVDDVFKDAQDTFFRKNPVKEFAMREIHQKSTDGGAAGGILDAALGNGGGGGRGGWGKNGNIERGGRGEAIIRSGGQLLEEDEDEGELELLVAAD